MQVRTTGQALNYIRQTETTTGLRVRAYLAHKHYENGQRIADKEVSENKGDKSNGYCMISGHETMEIDSGKDKSCLETLG